MTKVGCHSLDERLGICSNNVPEKDKSASYNSDILGWIANKAALSCPISHQLLWGSP